MKQVKNVEQFPIQTDDSKGILDFFCHKMALNQSPGIQDAMENYNYQQLLVQLFSMKFYNKSMYFECWTESGSEDCLIFSSSGDVKAFSYDLLQLEIKPKPLASSLRVESFKLYKYFESFGNREKTGN